MVTVIPILVVALSNLTLLFLGYNKNNEVYVAIISSTAFFISIMILILAQSRFKKLVYHAQWVFFLSYFILTILVINDLIPYSTLHIEFLERRQIYTIVFAVYITLGYQTNYYHSFWIGFASYIISFCVSVKTNAMQNKEFTLVPFFALYVLVTGPLTLSLYRSELKDTLNELQKYLIGRSN